jgi:hypothetical protein
MRRSCGKSINGAVKYYGGWEEGDWSKSKNEQQLTG